MARSQLTQPQQVSVAQLLALIPEALHDELARALSLDKWVPKLSAQLLFKLVLYSLLDSERLSLRTMAENYKTPWFQSLAGHMLDEVAHTSIRARLMTVKLDYSEKLCEHVYQQVCLHYSNREMQKYHIKRYDSTMIATFSHLLEGMRVGNTSRHKTQVKFTTEFKDDLLIRMRFFKDQAHLSEETALKQIIESVEHNINEIIVFDRGLKKRQTFESFNDQQLLFVTRTNEDTRYQVIESASEIADIHTDDLQFIQDSKVYLYASGNQLCETPFRLVEVKRKKDDQTILFLTNIFHLTAPEIANIYYLRWDIEVLFRFLKQEMNLKHFVSNDANAIMVMLYCTLIAATLILVYRKQNSIRSYKMAKIRFFYELQATVILELLDIEGGVDRLRQNVTKYLKRE